MQHLNIGKWTYDGLNESPAGRSQFLQIAVDFVDTVLFAGFQIGIDGQEDARSSAAIAEMAEYNFSFEESVTMNNRPITCNGRPWAQVRSDD